MSEKGGKPVYIVRAKQHPDREFMMNIGGAWAFKEGDGFVVKLYAVPTNWNGDMILVAPKDE